MAQPTTFWITLDIHFLEPVRIKDFKRMTRLSISSVKGEQKGRFYSGYIKEYGITHFDESLALSSLKEDLYEEDFFSIGVCPQDQH